MVFLVVPYKHYVLFEKKGCLLLFDGMLFFNPARKESEQKS